MKKFFYFTVVLLAMQTSGLTQGKGYLGGFQFKPMLGNGVFSNTAQTTTNDTINFSITNKFGYSFGMTIRKKFTKVLAIESGLRFTQRNYAVNIDSAFTSYSSSIDYRIIAYEIPLKAMVRLRSSDNSYFNVSLGGQIDLYPSDIFAYNFEWQVQVNRRSWVQGSFVTNLGWEIHPEDLGIFYIGLAYNQPFVPPFAANIGERNTTAAIVNMKQTGTFFSIDLRYYFEPKKEKGTDRDDF